MASILDNTPDFNDNDIREQSRKISSISSSVKRLQESEMRMVSNQKDVNRLVSTTSKVIQKMGDAVAAVGTGIKKTTVNSAKFTKDAIKQYGEALQEDVQLDVGKLRVLTTAGGPVIGYFINQLIKTPIFQNAIGSIKNKISDTMSAAGQKFKNVVSTGAQNVKNSVSSVFDKVGNVFSKLTGRKKSKELGLETIKKPETKRRGIFVERDGEVLYYPTEGRKKKKPIGTKIPKLQKGGVTGTGGLARLHPAEIVMPVNKLMKIQAKSQTETLKSFTSSFRKIQNEGYKEYNVPFYKRFIEGLFDIKSAIVKDPINLTYRLKSLWLNILEKHPLFRKLMRVVGVLGKVLFLPYNILFTRFGGKYKRLVSKDMNPLVASVKTMGAFYPLMTWKMDQMIQLLTDNLEANRDTASALTGKKYGKISLTKFGRTSLAQILGKLTKKSLISAGKLSWRMASSLTKKILKIEEKRTKKEKVRTPMEILIDIQAKALYRLELIARKIIPHNLFNKLMDREGINLRKIINLSDAELGIEKKRLTIQDKIKKGIIIVGEKLDKSKVVLDKVKDTSINTYKRTMKSVASERKRNESLNKISSGVEKVKGQVEKTGKKQVEKINEMIKHQKDHKSISKRIKEKFVSLKNSIKQTSKSVFEKVWGLMLAGFGMIKGLFGKVFGVGGTLLGGLGKILGKLPVFGMIVKTLSKLGGITKSLLPYADKLATFAARYVAPIAAAVGTIYGAIKAQEKYGAPIGEKLSWWERFGLGATETLDVATFGAFGLKETLAKDVEAAKKHREGAAANELKLLQAYQNRLKKGKITRAAFNRITEGGLEGLTDRLIKLKKDKEIVQVGDMMMTKLEKIGLPGAKALFKEKITEPLIGKATEIQTEANLLGPYAAMYAREKMKPIKETIETNITNPIISTAELAKIKASEKATEIKANLKSNEELKEGVEKMREYQGVVVNNFNKAINSVNNSISNAIGGAKGYKPDLDFSPSLMEIIKGDLD